MRKNKDIIDELRTDFTAIKGLLNHLSKLRSFSIEQELSIHAAWSSFGFLQSWCLCNIRKVFGDVNWSKLQDIDKPPEKIKSSINIKSILDNIQNQAKNLQVKILQLPGENGLTTDQAKEIDNLQEGLRWWRNVELPRLVSSFY